MAEYNDRWWKPLTPEAKAILNKHPYPEQEEKEDEEE